MLESDIDLFRRALVWDFITWHERELADVTDPGANNASGISDRLGGQRVL